MRFLILFLTLVNVLSYKIKPTINTFKPVIYNSALINNKTINKNDLSNNVIPEYTIPSWVYKKVFKHNKPYKLKKYDREIQKYLE